MYTSGSTGKPKGTIIAHYNITRVVLKTNYINILATDHVLQLSSYVFDGSVFDIYGALLNGATLVMISEDDIHDPARLGTIIQEEGITVSFFTSALFNLLVDHDVNTLQGMRKILIGGDRVSIQHALKALDHLGAGKLVNAYGPTESTVYATYFPIDEINQQWTTVPIGRPLANTQVYILDQQLVPLPVGVPGEIAISGDGLSQGYLNQKEITQSKFKNHPLYEGQKIYLTGDLGRWLPGNYIEFLGRMDEQVKLRGYRIEIGEIENQLLAHEQVKDAKVVVKNDKEEQYLVAYYILDGDLGCEDLKAWLSQWLPNYMLPAYYIPLDSFPLTINGKVDKKKLPVPVITAQDVIPPANNTEEQLVYLCSEILGVDKEKISTAHSFFELGGHSLKAAVLINRIYSEFNIRIAISEVFKRQTIAALAGYIDKQHKRHYQYIPKAGPQDYYPLTVPQKRLLSQSLLYPQALVYNIPQMLLVKGVVDKEKLEQAFSKLITRHESLRTGFIRTGAEPVQKIDDEVNFTIEYVQSDLGELEAVIRQFIRPFVLDQPPLFRVGWAELPGNEYLLMTDMHHIIADGISQGVLVKDFIALYNEQELPPLKLQHKDIAVWQDKHPERWQSQRQFWFNEFADFPEPLALPTDFERPKVKTFEGGSVSFELSIQQSQALRRLTKQEGVTMYVLVLGIFYTWLHKLSGQDDIVVGSPIAGREHPDFEGIIGMFVNTIPIRSTISSDLSFIDFLSGLEKKVLACLENQTYPYEDLVNDLKISLDPGRNPLFDVGFSYQSFDEVAVGMDGASIEKYDPNHKISKFDLTFTAAESEEQVLFHVEYASTLFKEETVCRLTDFFRQVLGVILDYPNKKIAEIEIISAEERKAVLHDFNPGQTSYPKDSSLIELFEKQARKQPARLAIRNRDFELTYSELQEKMNKIASFLQEEMSVKKGDFVGIMLTSEEYLIPSIFGILKAGASYVPLDPNYPKERINNILVDADVNTVITRSSYVASLAAHVKRVVNLDKVAANIESREPYCNDVPCSGVDHAYVMFTSGSTGKPKGVLVRHHNVSRVVKNTNYIRITQEDKLVQLSNYVFDGSVFDIFGALLNGATLVTLPPGVDTDVRQISEIISSEEVTVMFVTTALFNTLVDYKLESLLKVRKIITGGEQISMKHVERAFKLLGPGKLIHAYGPTESTVFTTCYPIDQWEESSLAVPIGKPISNTQVFILGPNYNPVPIGLVGEIYIGGDGLATRYINDEELTRQKFIEVPRIPVKRLYRTGDLGRWLPGGEVDFMGRMDNQVKIRGFRIELGEIEKQVLVHEDVEQAVVVAKGAHNDKFLVVYYTGKRITNEQWKKYLSQKLPVYMIPTSYVWLESMPLNKNAKIDRERLPEPKGESKQCQSQHLNKTESKLVEIWSEILAIPKDQIGPDDDFFELGGHSLRVASLQMKVQEVFNVEITVQEIFKGITIRQVAEYVDAHNWLRTTENENKETSSTEFI